MPTQDDSRLTAGTTRASVSPDAYDLLTEARALLSAVLPPSVRRIHEWAGALIHLRVDAQRVLQALQLHAGIPAAGADDADVRVHVNEIYLSMAGIVGVLDDGAHVAEPLPLHTGRYVRVILTNAQHTLAILWLPSVPVFQVTPRLAAHTGH
ncbi:hypothetical protein [Gemmatimonas sp.]|uniref:hypothetical protein n=1 Tax=Gemmatimonas sp. TaxID=1962908 RepID=UPI0031C793B6|nr:hypothetical protein [Gemmatimonas sp.]